MIPNVLEGKATAGLPERRLKKPRKTADVLHGQRCFGCILKCVCHPSVVFSLFGGSRRGSKKWHSCNTNRRLNAHLRSCTS